MILCCSLQLMLMLASGSNFFCFCKFSSCVIYFKSLAHKLLWASVHPVSHVYVAHVGCSFREGQSLSFTSHYGGGIILKASLKWLHEVNPKSVTVTGSRSSSMLGDQSWLFVLFYFLSLPPSPPELLRLFLPSTPPSLLGEICRQYHIYIHAWSTDPLWVVLSQQSSF